MNIFEALKSHDLQVLLHQRGVEINAQGYAVAPWRNERSASVKIYEKHWHDFGSPDKRGDLVDWLEQAEGMSKSEAVEEAKKIIGFTDKAPSKRRTSPPTNVEPTPKLSWVADFVAQSHEALKRQVTEAAQAAHHYFERRKIVALIDPLQLGVVDETVNVPQAGNKMKTFQGRAIIPILENGTPVGFKARYLGSETDAELKENNIAKYDGPPGSLAAPFNAAALEYAKKQGFLVLTEGEIDAASLLAAYGTDYPVLGLSGGIPKGWPERISKAGVRVFIVTDPDEAGRGHAERYRAQLSGLGVRCYIVNLPGTEDLNEMLISLGAEALMLNLENAFEAAALESTSDLRYVRETWLAELDARARRPYNHYTTGLPALDGILDGGYLEGLHLIGGITGGGKTAFALHVALTNALAGRPVIYASYEQSRLELWGRIATRLTGVPYSAIKRGTYDE